MVTFAWRDRQLKVDPNCLMPFNEAELTAGADVKASTSGTESSVAFKNRKPVNFTLTVLLMASAGVNVKDEVAGWQSLIDGTGGKIYIGGVDYIGRDMILTDCPATELKFSGGTMTSAKMKMTFQQASNPTAKKKTKKTETAAERLARIAKEAWKKADPSTYTALSKEQIEAMRKTASDAIKKLKDNASQVPSPFDSAFGPEK